MPCPAIHPCSLGKLPWVGCVIDFIKCDVTCTQIFTLSSWDAMNYWDPSLRSVYDLWVQKTCLIFSVRKQITMWLGWLKFLLLRGDGWVRFYTFNAGKCWSYWKYTWGLLSQALRIFVGLWASRMFDKTSKLSVWGLSDCGDCENEGKIYTLFLVPDNFGKRGGFLMISP